MKMDVDLIRREIVALLAAHPELADDDTDLLLALESETVAIDTLRQIERIRQEVEAYAAALNYQVSTLHARKERFEWREQKMRELAFNIMQTAGLKSLPMPEATYSIRPGPRKVIITDENLIPDILCKIERTPKKADIKELLKAGKPVQGATLSNQEDVLSIRTR